MKSNLHRLYVILGYVCVFLWSSSAFPVHPDHLDNDGQLEEWRTVIGALVAVALIVCVVVVSVQCLCCDIKPRRSTFNQDRSRSLTPIRENGAASTEFTIFPPVGSQQLVDPRNDDDVKFEPLPDIHPRRQNSVPTNQKPRPATFSNVVTKGLSLRDWFEDPHSNFPRKQLQYVRELGSGWFGQVVEGEAYGIVPIQRKTKVVVKILMEGANTTDQMYFLHEVKPFRDLDHPNVLKLLGKCLESDPFLIILEHCAFKDLKSYLIHHRTEAESLFNQNLLLRMVCNAAAGLLHAHEHGFVLTDLAARNCVVSSDLVVKIGDYGNSIELYKDDYYCAGGIAVPVRWCAPETLRCTETIMETREVTQEANIWSFGVVLWEILEFGKLPYIELSDDELIQKVIIDRTEVLKRPLTPYSHVNRLYQIIQLCQLSPTNRPSMEKIHAMLSYLYAYKMESSDSAAEFETRWNQLQPRRPLPKASSSYAGSHIVDSGSSPYNGDSIFVRDTSSSPNLSLSYDSDFGHPIIVSPSLQNLRGSIDDLRIEEGDRRNDPSTLSTDSYYAAVSSALNPYEQDSRTESAMSFLDPSLHSVANNDVPSLSSLTDVSNKALEERHSSTSSKEVSPFTREVQEVIRKLDQDLDEACPSLVDALQTSSLDGSLDPVAASEDTRMDNSLFGDESYLNSISSEVEFDSLTHDVGGVVSDTLEKVKEGSEDDDDDLSWRKIVETSNEQSGEITRIIREKSQSVQDFLKLTVIDSESGSDSDVVPNKNELAASGSEGDASSPKALRRQVQVRRRQSADDILLDIRGEEGRGTGGGGGGAVVFANLGDGLTQLHAVNGLMPVSFSEPVHVDAVLPPGSIRSSHSSDGSISCDTHTDSPGVVPVHHSLDRLADELVTDSLFQALPEVLSSRYNATACAMAGDWTLDHSFGTVDTFLSPLNTHCRVPPIVVHEAGDPSEESDCEEEHFTHGPKFGLNFRFVFNSLDDDDDVGAMEKLKDTSVIYSETSATEIPSQSTNVDPLVTSPRARTSTPRSRSSDEYALSFADGCSFELDVFGTDSETQVALPECGAFSETRHDTASGPCPDGGAAASVTDGSVPAQNEPVPLVGMFDYPSQISTGVVDDDELSTIVGGSGNNLFIELHEGKLPENRSFPRDDASVPSNAENFKPSYSFVAKQHASSKTSAPDQLVLADSSCSMVEGGHSSNGSLSSNVESFSFIAKEQASKLVDFEEFVNDGGLSVLTRPGYNICEVKELPKAMREIQTVSTIFKDTDSDVYDQIPGTKIEDSRHSVGGNLDGEFTMERRSISTPDIVIDSAFAYLCVAASGPDDLCNANAPEGSDSLLDFKSVVGGPLSEGCSTASASPTILRSDSNECPRTSSAESTTTDESGPDRTASLDEGFEPSESNESCPESEAVSSSSQLDPMALNHSTEEVRAEDSQKLGSSSSLYSPDEDCVMLVDLETNEAVLLDRPKSKLTFAQDAWEKSSNDANSEDDLCSSSISFGFPKNGISSAKETSTSNDFEDDVLDEDCGVSLATTSKSDEAFEQFEGESSHDVTQSSGSGGGRPFESGSSSEDTSTSGSPTHSKDSDNSIASDWQFVSRETQKTERVFIDKSSFSEDRPDVECNSHTMEEAPQELTPELLFLMQLTSKMEKLGLKSHDDAIERRPLPITESSNESSSMDSGNRNSNEGPDGCVPPTSSPTNGPNAIPGEMLLSPQWETSTDSSSSPSGCHSPSSASSTSGEFDCAKEFKFESFKTPEVIPDGDENDDDDEEETEQEEEDQADDEGGYGDDEGEDEDSLVDSFKASTWDKDATPTKGLLRSPDKQYQSEGKKTVSFKVQKRSVIYEYPKEEIEDEEAYDPSSSHSVWTYHMYNPELDYSRYADWDLEEGAPENVEVEEYDDEGSSESSSDFMGQSRNPDQAHALYKLSDIPDEDLASDYSSEGGSASYYAHHDSFDFASYLDHYNGSPLFSGVPGKNQDDEDFWLETILNSSDFFVSGTDCPFVFDDEGGEEGKGLPQWALSPGTFNMYVDMQNGTEFVNGLNPRYELETGHYGDYVEEEDDDVEPAQYEREGHVSRMGEYKEVDAEEEEPLDDGKDDGVGPWDEVDSGESAESVAMETDSTDENLDEVKTDRVTNLINNNLLPSVVSERPKTSNDTKPSAPRINGTESRSEDDDVGTTDWNGSSSKSSEDIINRGSSQLETAA